MTAENKNPYPLAIGGLLSLAAAMGIGRFVYTPILPFMAGELGLSADQAGVIASANFVGYLIGALVGASPLVSRRPRVWFLGGLLASALTSAAMAATQTVALFAMLRFLSGLASAFVLVCSTSLILERLAEAGKSTLSAVHFAGVGCGIAFSAVMISTLGFLAAGQKAMWIASGAATALTLLIVFLLVPAKTGSGGANPPASASEHKPAGLKDMRLVRLIIAYGLFGFGYVITATFVSVIARTTPALMPAEPFVWLFVGLSAAPSIYVWNRISNRTGLSRAFAIACILEAAGVALTVVTAHPLTFLLGATLLGGTFMGITALGLIEARRLVSTGGPSAVQRTLAFMTASFGTGQVIGPWFAGQVHALSGTFVVSSLTAALALIVAALLVGLPSARAQAWENSQ